jgi:CheY-like chemotaxis protein
MMGRIGAGQGAHLPVARVAGGELRPLSRSCISTGVHQRVSYTNIRIGIGMEIVGMMKRQLDWRRVGVVFLGVFLVLTGIAGLLVPILPGIFLLAMGLYLLSPRCYSRIRGASKQSKERLPLINRLSLWLSDQTSATDTTDSGTFHRQGSEKARPGGSSNQELEKAETAAPKILIFDPNPQDLARYSEAFERFRCEVHKCMSVEAAMRCIEREELDLALVDQISPSFEALRIIRHLVRYNLRTPFVVLAGMKDTRCQHEALALGAIDYLEKPLSQAYMAGIMRLLPT